MEAFGIHLAEKNTKEIFLTRFANNELTGAKKSDKEKRYLFGTASVEVRVVLCLS